MLKVEHTSVMNFEGALRGARNPLKSHHKSDSCYCNDLASENDDGFPCEKCRMFQNGSCTNRIGEFIIGENDLDLMGRLVKAGSSHRKFIRQIFVSVDITAPFYWWKQFDQYKIGVVTNSESTMHKIHAKEFELSDFSCEHLIDNLSECDGISFEDGINTPKEILLLIIDTLNTYRHWFLETKDKKYWYQMIQLLPNSYNQKRTVTFDYENLRNMYHERKNHKLDEWHTFCEWIESLPYSELIAME